MTMGNVDLKIQGSHGPAGLEALMRWLAQRSGSASLDPQVTEEEAAALGARPAPAKTGGGGAMRDYLGNEVSGAMELIKALAPPPPMPQPMTQMGNPGGGPPAAMGRARGGMVRGPGDGRSDSVPGFLGDGPAEGQGAIQVSDGEFVIPADVVSGLGRGSSEAGSRQLTDMVEGVRKGYAKHLGKLPDPAKGGRTKFLGGLFDSKTETKIEEPAAIAKARGDAGALLSGIFKSRLPREDVAGLTPDQIASMDQARRIATTDPYGIDSAYGGARGVASANQAYFDEGQRQIAGAEGQLDNANRRVDPQYDYLTRAQSGLDSQRNRVGGAQDYLSDVLGPGGSNQELIDASLGDFDYQRDKDVASAARLRAGRGAFGERRAIAEDEESVASNLARSKLSAGLRDDAISRRMAAAQGIGGLAQTGIGVENASGNLTGAAGNLASTQGQLAETRGGLASRSGVLAGQNIGAASAGADLAADQRQIGVANASLLGSTGEQLRSYNQQLLDAPYDRVGRASSFISGAPSATSTSSQPSPFQIGLGLASVGAGFIKDGGMVPGKKKRAGRKGRTPKYAMGGMVGMPRNVGDVQVPFDEAGTNTSRFVDRVRAFKELQAGGGEVAPQAGAPAFDEAGTNTSRFLARLQAQRAAQGNEPVPGMPAIGGGGPPAMQIGVPGKMRRPPPVGGFDRQPFGMFADGGEIEFPQPGWLGAKLGIRPVLSEMLPEALGMVGMDYEGADPDGAGGVPNRFERRSMRDKQTPTKPSAAPAPKPIEPETMGPDAALAATAAPAPKKMADRVEQRLNRAEPAAPRKAPSASQPTRNLPPVPRTRPSPDGLGLAALSSPEEPVAVGTPGDPFKPRQDAGGAGGPGGTGAPPQSTGWAGFKDRIESGLDSPLTQFGFALLADDGRSGLGGAIGKAGQAASRSSAEKKRRKREDDREQRLEDREDRRAEVELRRLGLSEEQAKAAIANYQSLEKDRIEDNARMDAKDAETAQREDRRLAETARREDQRLALAQGNAGGINSYRNSMLALAREREDRLKKTAEAVGKTGKPTNAVALYELRKRLGQMLDPTTNTDPEDVDKIRSQIAALEMAGGGGGGSEDALDMLPDGFDLEPEEE